MSRMLKPLPWKLNEERNRQEYEMQGSRFVKTLAMRAHEEASIAEQYSRVLNIEKDNVPKVAKIPQEQAYLDDVKEENWPHRAKVSEEKPVSKRRSNVKTTGKVNVDVDRLLHPWQREMKALINNSVPMGDLPPLVRITSSGKVKDSTSSKKTTKSESAAKTPPKNHTNDSVDLSTFHEESSLGEEDGSTIGWSPFSIPS